MKHRHFDIQIIASSRMMANFDNLNQVTNLVSSLFTFNLPPIEIKHTQRLIIEFLEGNEPGYIHPSETGQTIYTYMTGFDLLGYSDSNPLKENLEVLTLRAYKCLLTLYRHLGLQCSDVELAYANIIANSFKLSVPLCGGAKLNRKKTNKATVTAHHYLDYALIEVTFSDVSTPPKLKKIELYKTVPGYFIYTQLVKSQKSTFIRVVQQSRTISANRVQKTFIAMIFTYICAKEIISSSIMTDEQVKNLIRAELTQKTLGVTEQYLEIHEVVYEAGELKIDRIDREDEEGLIIAYLPIKDECFSLAVYIDGNENTIQNIGTESRNQVLLRATSNELTIDELQSMTKLVATRVINQGDLKPNKKSKYAYSVLDLEPNPHPDALEDKLEKLLTFLEQDREGIRALGKKSTVWVSATMDFHYGNQLLGNALISQDKIKRLADLNLSIEFDLSAWGNPFK
jgi:hypothetical protein